jgi:hypothetical protein
MRACAVIRSARQEHGHVLARTGAFSLWKTATTIALRKPAFHQVAQFLALRDVFCQAFGAELNELISVQERFDYDVARGFHEFFLVIVIQDFGVILINELRATFC